MGMQAMWELLIGVLVALSAPTLVWLMVIAGLVKVLRRSRATEQSTPSGSIEA